MELTETSPARGMKTTLMLADAAQVAEGKLYVMGGGWTMTASSPNPFAIAGIIDIPWELANEHHAIRFELIDVDGKPIVIETPSGPEAAFIAGEFEVGRPPGTPKGAAIPMPLAINHPGLQLPSGGRFEWRYAINGGEHEDWRLAFGTRPDNIQSIAA